MITARAAAVATHEPLSIKSACIGFAACTTAMTLIMVLVGNLV